MFICRYRFWIMKDLPSFLKPITVLFVLSFVLNLVWEILQVPLYEGFHYSVGGFGVLIWASAGDAMYITLIAVLSFGGRIAALFKKDAWFILRIAFFAVMLLINSYRVELSGLSNGWWSYSEKMPILFGVGLSPLFELITTGLIGLVLVKKVSFLKKMSMYEKN